ncbi:MAG: TIGR01621 family pseudouridine synthase [Parashewanella sp.]
MSTNTPKQQAYQLIADEDDFIIINKFPNVHFHSQDGQAGVVAQVELDRKQKLYPVHRLDSPTSGLLIFAKSSQTANQLAELFKAHQVQKYYLAIAKGKPKKKQGWVIGDMAKSRRGMHKLLHSKQNPAITQFFSYALQNGLRLYLLKPHSGKTHQLRVALTSLGSPILGDPLYGKDDSDRCYLHAYCLEFELNDKAYFYQCVPEIGDAFTTETIKQQLKQLRQPQLLDWPQSKKKDSR